MTATALPCRATSSAPPALGIRNLTCLTGDHQGFGNQAGAKKVYDVDSVQLVGMVKRMRDEHKVLGSEEEMVGSVPMLIGVAANPFAKPYEFRALRLAKKVEAGADYVQTQCVFDVPMFAEWMKAVRDLGVHAEVQDPRRCHPAEVGGNDALHGGERAGDRSSPNGSSRG